MAHLPDVLCFEALPEPGERFVLGERIGAGVYSEVFEATDSEQGGRNVAVKVVTLTLNVAQDVKEEYRVLRRLHEHPCLPDLYGAFLKRGESRKESDQLWFVLELCEGGPITDLVASLHKQGRRMCEEHIAYVLKEAAKGLVHLHENHVVHRDVKGSNILLTKGGEVKLVDFGLARELAGTIGKSGTILGSPCWMAPEVVSSKDEDAYDTRADVWALGIVAIELADGKPPFFDMHPTRALFQIVRNPPPSFMRPSSWSQVFNDFLNECLVKNPEHRPYMVEVLEHPFLTQQQQNEYTLQQELRVLSEGVGVGARPRRPPELALRGGLLQARHTAPPEPLRVEDAAALAPLTEDSLLAELQERLRRGEASTFAGDVLIVLTANEPPDDSPRSHAKYQFKSRSENAPHPFAVADCALQDALHHELPQHVLLAGESAAGKSAVLRRLLAHFAFLGKTANNVGERVERSLMALNSFANAATAVHSDSTRHLLQLQLTFTRTGKLSGAILWLSMLEKGRVCSNDSRQSNFHVFYYLVDALEADGTAGKYGLQPGRLYRYLRRENEGRGLGGPEPAGGWGPRDVLNRAANVAKFRELQQRLRDTLELEEEALQALWAALAAILLLGELQFDPDPDADVEVEDEEDAPAKLRNPDVVAEVARLLAVEEKKLQWALLHYCVVEKGVAARRRHTVRQASDARHVLASTLYARLVDWLVNVANWRLAYTRAVYGDPHVINIVDFCGFECHRRNGLETLFFNTLNEQLHYYYNQRVFSYELQDAREEELPAPPLRFRDNKATLDALLGRRKGLLYLMDDPEVRGDPARLAALVKRAGLSPHVTSSGPDGGGRSGPEISVAHYAGTVTYNCAALLRRSKDFLPPDLVEVMRQSGEPIVQHLFANRLSKAGALTTTSGDPPPGAEGGRGGSEGAGAAAGSTAARRRRWGAALMADHDRKARKYNTSSWGQFSQSRGQRTAAAVFRAAGLEALRVLAGGGLHAVRCVRAALHPAPPRAFTPELVRQQMRALALLDTARARRDGFPCRVPFAEFLRRYKFLAFDFDEEVEETRDNSRLLLVRLKMEGWVLGRTKVFLTYYNEEYLARLYETQVKKIVRVQTMMRAFLARRTVKKVQQLSNAAKTNKIRRKSEEDLDSVTEEEQSEREGRKEEEKDRRMLTQDEAATIIQAQFRGYKVRKQTQIFPSKNPLNEHTLGFIRDWCHRWRARTIFQVLMLYRATRRQELIYFCQQVHLYDGHAVSALHGREAAVDLSKVEPAVRASTWLGRPRPPVCKQPFRLCDAPFVDPSPFCQPGFSPEGGGRGGGRGGGSWDTQSEGAESWDAPLRCGQSPCGGGGGGSGGGGDDSIWGMATLSVRDQEVQTGEGEGGRGPEGAQEGEASDCISREPFRRDAEGLEEFTRRRMRGCPTPDGRTAVYKASRSRTPQYDVGHGGGRMDSPMVARAGGRGPIGGKGPTGARAPAPSYAAPRPYAAPQPPTQPSAAADQRGRVKGRGGPDPIAELEQRARRAGAAGGAAGDDQVDDPPFNFQAMLRKTNHNRASLKRPGLEQQNYGANCVYNSGGDFNKNNSYSSNYNSANAASKDGNTGVTKRETYAAKLDYRGSYEELDSRGKSAEFGRESKTSFGCKGSRSCDDNKWENDENYDNFTNTDIQQKHFGNRKNRSSDINRNIRQKSTGEEMEVRELVPGIMIQGGEVAEL